MVAINYKELRPIDNLIYWSMVLPPANKKYEVLSEYTDNPKFIYERTCKNENDKHDYNDYLSDDRYLSSKNKATCATVDYVKAHIDDFINDDDERVYDEDSDGIDESAFEGSEWEPIRTPVHPSVYVNIAMKARFSFAESTLVCPCHKSNEYYYRMHYIQQPDDWCSGNKKNFKSIQNLIQHMDKKSNSCKWHEIFYVFYSSFLSEENKMTR